MFRKNESTLPAQRDSHQSQHSNMLSLSLISLTTPFPHAAQVVVFKGACTTLCTTETRCWQLESHGLTRPKPAYCGKTPGKTFPWKFLRICHIANHFIPSMICLPWSKKCLPFVELIHSLNKTRRQVFVVKYIATLITSEYYMKHKKKRRE